MSDRTSIKDALVAQMNTEFTAANEGVTYYNDLDQNVKGDILYLEEMEVFPAITVALGPERVEYLPSGFRWQFLTLYIRSYVKSEDETEQRLEQLLADIKTFVDNFERLVYTVINPDGTTTEKMVTQMTTIAITTDEGLLKPNGIGEMNIEVRYADRNSRK